TGAREQDRLSADRGIRNREVLKVWWEPRVAQGCENLERFGSLDLEHPRARVRYLHLEILRVRDKPREDRPIRLAVPKRVLRQAKQNPVAQKLSVGVTQQPISSPAGLNL